MDFKFKENNHLLKTCVNYRTNLKMKFIITYLSSFETTEFCVDKFEKGQHLRLDTLCQADKIGILTNHMNKNKLQSCRNSYESNHNNPIVIEDLKTSVLIYKQTIDNIINTNTSQGFPSLCKTFCSNRYLLYLENRYFETPSKFVIDAVNKLRDNTTICERIKYAVLAFIMIDESVCLINNEMKDEKFHKICKKINICESDLQSFKIKDAADELVGTFLKEDSGLYEFSCTALSRAVWMSYCDVDALYCIMNCNWTYIEDYVRPPTWPFHKHDVCLPQHNSLIIQRLEKEINGGCLLSVSKYLQKCFPSCCDLIDNFCQLCMDSYVNVETFLSLCREFSKLGTSFELFNSCSVAKYMLSWCNVDTFGNCLLHYCVLQDYIGMMSDMPFTFIDTYMIVLNKSGYAPYHFEFFFGRHKMIAKHLHCIPRTYENYSKLNKLVRSGEQKYGGLVKTKHLNQVGDMFLESDFTKHAKFGSKLDFMCVKDQLLLIKNESMKMVRIKALLSHIKDIEIEKVFTQYGCEIITQYRERHRQKGRISNIETGDHIVICKPFTISLPRLIRICELQVEIYHDNQVSMEIG